MLCYIVREPLFPLGNLLISPEIITLGVDAQSLLRRHQFGDYGCVDPYDAEQNHHAIECGDAILSQYYVMVGEKKILICVMTEGNRSYTVLFILDQKKLKSPAEPGNGNNQSAE